MYSLSLSVSNNVSRYTHTHGNNNEFKSLHWRRCFLCGIRFRFRGHGKKIYFPSEICVMRTEKLGFGSRSAMLASFAFGSFPPSSHFPANSDTDSAGGAVWWMNRNKAFLIDIDSLIRSFFPHFSVDLCDLAGPVSVQCSPLKSPALLAS